MLPLVINKPLYVEVILPLKLREVYTYWVPDELAADIVIGKRVVVQFGPRRFYTAIVRSILSEISDLIKPKPILSIVDTQPVVNETQLRFWEWMAHYYLCTKGEVMQAALPAALKLNSTTIVAIDPTWEGDDAELNTLEFTVAEILRNEGPKSLDDLESLLKVKRIHQLVHGLMHKQAVIVEETLQERYRPRWMAMISLHEDMQTEALLNATAENLQRSPKQLELLMRFLHLSDEMGPSIPRQTLLNGSSTALLKKLIEKGILVETRQQIDRVSGQQNGSLDNIHPLNERQAQALQQIQQEFERHAVVLLHGVTSSGKTHLYVQLIQDAIAQGKQVLYLLPEIALTSQITQKLAVVFGDQLGIYHSKFNDQEKVEIWTKVLNGDYRVILGARSALLLPFQDLGLVIVDEEHDGSYKQHDPAPRYQARDSAIYLASLYGAKTLLGSATPSLESYYNAESGKYGMVRLSERYGGIALPVVQVINMAEETKRKRMHGHFSATLLEAVEAVLQQKEQVILFHNKRGYAPYLICADCAWIPKCRNCDVSLTYHKQIDILRCHYCGFQRTVPNSCEQCEHTHLKIQGYGTEMVEEELKLLLPEARIARFDLDSTKGKKGHETIIEQFQSQQIDILVGTQMITKGLDFGNVSLVGILSADQLLAFPDFRSHERAHQLMEQVSGRAGRRQKKGLVLIQATDPDHHIIQQVVQHQWKEYYAQELKERQKFFYPPYARLIQLTVKHRDRAIAKRAAEYLANAIREKASCRVMGPVVPVIGRIRNQYLQDILLKLKKEAQDLSFHKQLLLKSIDLLKHHAEFSTVQVVVDVDP
ncbi:MAG: primosomal protein N' [Chitinophagales bacterium]|nr:primosomal protein N' [Chitinophagales bacterium]